MAGRAEQMRQFWDERAREDAFYFIDNREPYRATDLERFWDAADSVDYFLDGLGVRLDKTDTVLEIGCGVGRVARVLAAKAGEVVALDISYEMLTQARRHNAELENVRWVLGDGVSLSAIGDESIDACVSLVVFQHIPDPAITLGYVTEVGRALRPGGWAALQVSNDPRIHLPRKGLRMRLKTIVGHVPRGQRHPAWLGSHVELDSLREAARQGGLQLEKVWGEGSQYCQVLLRKRAGAPARPPSA